MNHVAQLISDRNHIDNVFFFKQKTAYEMIDRKSTRLNSSHQIISYAVFCLKKKNDSVGVRRIMQFWHDLGTLVSTGPCAGRRMPSSRLGPRSTSARQPRPRVIVD